MRRWPSIPGCVAQPWQFPVMFVRAWPVMLLHACMSTRLALSPCALACATAASTAGQSAEAKSHGTQRRGAERRDAQLMVMGPTPQKNSMSGLSYQRVALRMNSTYVFVNACANPGSHSPPGIFRQCE